MVRSWISGSLFCLWGVGTVLGAGPSIAVLPSRVTLSGPAASHALLVERVLDDQFLGSPAGEVTWSVGDPQIVKIENGVAVPLSNGRTTVTAEVAGQSDTTEITVEQFDKPHEVSFRNQVQSVFAKAGCNSGACHGAAAGKNGFKLSLRGYDADADYFAITRQARGRRIAPADPARSLLLTKPTGAIAHRGGVRFEVDSPEYRTVASWIAQGARPPAESDARIEQLEILPRRTLLKPKDTRRILVQARFSDGRVEDVTRLVKFASSNEAVAQVNQSGQVSVVGQGEAVLSGWYLSFNAVATVTVSYEQAVDEQAFAQAPSRNFIDELVLKQLKRLNLPPSPPASDAEFLRRAFIDTIGTLPTADEVRAFLSDNSADKRDRLIEALLERPEFVDYWTYKWSDLLLVNSEKLRPPAMWAYYRWIRAQVADNTPWDELARRILTAKGSTIENGAANFFVLHPDPTELAETTSQAFLGMSINCAKCHNHPLEKWTNDQYFGMANLFARVKVKDGRNDGEAVVFNVASGELLQPRTGKPQPPRPLDAQPVPFDSPLDRRAVLADWVTSADNPYFARAITNRLWANFFGAGLVESVDDLRLTNPASNEELLNAAAQFLVRNRYDLKSLMRAMLQSATYQRTSQSLPTNAFDRRYYARYYPRRIMAEALLDAYSQISGASTQFFRESGDRKNKNLGGQGDPYPPNFRAIQLPDSNVLSYFLKSFGRPQRLLTCECERTDEPSMVQVLHLSNGDTINDKLATPGNRLDQILASKAPPERVVEDAYLSSLARYPTPAEKDPLVQALADAPESEKRLVLEDLYWSLLSSKEFLLNH